MDVAKRDFHRGWKIIQGFEFNIQPNLCIPHSSLSFYKSTINALFPLPFRERRFTIFHPGMENNKGFKFNIQLNLFELHSWMDGMRFK